MHKSHRHSFKLIPLAFIAMMVLGLIFMGGRSRSQSAWMEGYMMGQLSAGEDGGDAIPYYGHRGFTSGGSHRLGGLIPMLLCGGFLLMLGLICLPLMFFGMFFGRKRWGRFGGQPGKKWAKYWKKQWHHGPRPPWCWDEEDDDDDEADVAEEPAEPR